MHNKVFRKWLFPPLKGIQHFLGTLFNLIYPPLCFLCRTRLQDTSQIICQDCWRSFTRVNSPNIPPSIAFIESIHFEQNLSVWKFDAKYQKIVHLLKYHGITRFVKPIAQSMAQLCQDNPQFMDADILIPVPLHRARIRERGYNQSLLLCEEIGRILDKKVVHDAIIRRRNTRTQTELNRNERIKNVRYAFKVIHATKIRNKAIILVDDVMTTGATLNACAWELKKNGADKVLVLTAGQA